MSPLPGCGRAVCRSLRHCLRFACLIFYPGSAPGWGSGRWCESDRMSGPGTVAGCSREMAGGRRRWGLENSDASSWLPVWLRRGGGGGEDRAAISTPSLHGGLPSLGHTAMSRVDSNLNLGFRFSGSSRSPSSQCLGIFQWEEAPWLGEEVASHPRSRANHGGGQSGREEVGRTVGLAGAV